MGPRGSRSRVMRFGIGLLRVVAGTKRAVVGVLVGCMLVGCWSGRVTPRHASWEPATDQLPTVADRAEARRMLELSRLEWTRGIPHPWGFYAPARSDGDYTYVRARQRSRRHVDFTILAVEDKKVRLRALVAVDPDDLGRTDLAGAQIAWVERGSLVGSHDEGSPALTIDELYDACERDVLGAHPEHAPRLYFHPRGLLMQCGFARGDCSDCAGVSIQAVGPHSVAGDAKLGARGRWLCHQPWGLFPPAAADPVRSEWCAPAVPLDLHRDPDHESLLHDICIVDPSARPSLRERDHAEWESYTRSLGTCGTVHRTPTFLDVGKAQPPAGWLPPQRDLPCGPSRGLLSLGTDAF